MMKLLKTAVLLLLNLCNIAGAAVLPITSPDVANLTSDVIRHYSPSHGTCFVLVGIIEKKPKSVKDRESSAWVSIWDGKNKAFEGLTWDDGEPVRGLITEHAINGKPPGEALKIHGLFSPTDCFSIKWINMTPGGHWEWLVFSYSGGTVADEMFDDRHKDWVTTSCNRTEWVNSVGEDYDRMTRCYFQC